MIKTLKNIVVIYLIRPETDK